MNAFPENRPPTVVDLFSGAGGFSLGFRAAGCEIAAAVDIDEAAGRTFDENFRKLQPGSPPVVFSGVEADLEGLDLEEVAGNRNPDILIGGPPCQGFSLVGRAKLESLSEDGFEDDPRNQLYRRFLDAGRLWKPRAIVMENVPGMRSVKGANVADSVAAELAALGYNVGFVILNAAWFGVPQFRDRIFFIGIRDDLGVQPAAPKLTHKAAMPPGYARPPEAWNLTLPFIRHAEIAPRSHPLMKPATTVRQALEDLPALVDHLDPSQPRRRGDFRQFRRYARAPSGEYSRLMRSWPGVPDPSGVDDHEIRHTPRDYETFRRMRPGDRYPQALAIARIRFADALGTLRKGGKAPEEGSPEWQELRRRFVPPYPEEIFVDKWRKLLPEQPSWTIPAHLAKDAYSHIHYDDSQARALSVREAARLQSFPDGFRFSGNMGDCFRQIGNAVPPILAWAVAMPIIAALGFAATPPPFEP